jgi:hypothetical protein
MAYQDDVPLGPITGGMDIGSDDDDGPKQPATDMTLEGGPTRTPSTRAIMPTPKPSLGT